MLVSHRASFGPDAGSFVMPNRTNIQYTILYHPLRGCGLKMESRVRSTMVGGGLMMRFGNFVLVRGKANNPGTKLLVGFYEKDQKRTNRIRKKSANASRVCSAYTLRITSYIPLYQGYVFLHTMAAECKNIEERQDLRLDPLTTYSRLNALTNQYLHVSFSDLSSD